MCHQRDFAVSLIENLNVVAKWKLCLFVCLFIYVLVCAFCSLAGVYGHGMAWNQIQSVSFSTHRQSINLQSIITKCRVHTAHNAYRKAFAFGRLYVILSLPEHHHSSSAPIHRIENKIETKQQATRTRNTWNESLESGSCYRTDSRGSFFFCVSK